MTQSATDNRCHLGFFQVAQTEQGYVGGFLVTNHLGRPLEFQCTTPVRPNRTQEILYGPTLEPFVYTELIGKTLLTRLGVKPNLIVIRQPMLLDLRSEWELPVTLLLSPEDEKSDLPDELRIQLGRQPARLHADHPDDRDRITSLLGRIPGDADMLEPLDRVKEALQETLKAGAGA